MTSLAQYIENEGAMLSGQLIDFIVQSDNIGRAAARKRIERLKSPAHKLSGFFIENQSFIYHSSLYNTDAYFSKLKEAFKVASKRSYAILTAIDYHYGIISKKDLPNYTFSPISNIKGHLRYSTLIDKLIAINVLFEFDDTYFRLNPLISNNITPNLNHYKAIKFAQDLLMYQFQNWSRNLGICSFRKGQMNSSVGGFQFAFTAPTYINGLVQYRGNQINPGFVIVDVLIGNETKSQEVDFFIQKIAAIRASNPSLKLLPVLLIDEVHISALNKLKQNGILVGIIKELFGESYNELLKNLINTITNAGTILKKDPEKYISLMIQLTKLIEGKTNNLRGDLFELAVGYYYGQFCKYLEIGKRIRVDSDTKTLELDVLAIYEAEVIIAECKGYNYPIDDKYILDYLNNKLPKLRSWLQQKFPQKVFNFEIWSTGGFTEDAKQLLKKAQNTTKYKFDFFGKSEILEKAQKLQTSKFVEILKNYYLKEIT